MVVHRSVIKMITAMSPLFLTSHFLSNVSSGCEKTIPFIEKMPGKPQKNVLTWLEHIFPYTYRRIKEHISPAMVGTGCLEFKLPAGS